MFEFWFTEDGRLKDEEAFSANLASHLFFSNKEIHLSAEVDKPIVFIGAPAAKYARGIKGLIGVEIIVPDNHGVANAVGAITGAIREDITILIRPHIDGGYVAYTSEEKLLPTTFQVAFWVKTGQKKSGRKIATEART